MRLDGGRGRGIFPFTIPVTTVSIVARSRQRIPRAKYYRRVSMSLAANTKRDSLTDAPADEERLDRLCIDTIRTLAIDAVQKANSGHAGTPMAMAPVMYTLWQQFLRYDPADPHLPNRVRI